MTWKTDVRAQVEKVAKTKLHAQSTLAHNTWILKIKIIEVFEDKVAKLSANQVARIGANHQPFCETLTWRLWRKTNVKAGKPEIEHRVQAGCQHVVLHQQAKDPQ